MSEPAVDTAAPAATPVTLHVCVTCKLVPGDPQAAPELRGRDLLAALEREVAARGLGDQIRLLPVECLSVCKRPATVAASGDGCWTYVWGDLQPARDTGTLLDGLLAYALAPAGIIPWKQRPHIFKSGVIARVPPPSPTRKGTP